ncbi:hypothetical protein ACU686_11890 [Yinghuangia aomiensis]
MPQQHEERSEVIQASMMPCCVATATTGMSTSTGTSIQRIRCGYAANTVAAPDLQVG